MQETRDSVVRLLSVLSAIYRRPIFFFFFYESHGFYGFVDSIEPMGGGRIAVQLDAIASDVFDSDGGKSKSEKGLGFLRIVSTADALQKMLADFESISIGDWIEVVTTPDLSARGPWVWSLQLREDRFVGDERTGRPTRGKVIGLRRLSRASQPIDPQPLGAAQSAQLAIGSSLKKRYSLAEMPCIVPPGRLNRDLRRFGRAWATAEAVAHDVGQASFNVISPQHTRGPLLFFDVGQPIWFHLHNAPSNFAPPSRPGGFVILSHWDTDHYAYGRQNSAFHKKCWIAPAQTSVGPNAETFARQLADDGKLILVGAGKSSRHRRGARIIRCNGHSINGSGLALHLKTFGRNILLAGDADYHEIPSIGGVRLSGLQVPHHGGGMSPLSVVPTASERPARAVVSCGLPNRYGHPNDVNLKAHESAEWNIAQTASANGIPRGERPF